MRLPRYARAFAKTLQRFPWIVTIANVGYRSLRPKVTLGVTAVIFNERDEILLVEHIFHPMYPWGLPGGWVDAREHPETAILRELKEEVKVTAAIEQFLLSELVTPGHLDFAYLCTIEEPVESVSNELLDFGWFSPQQLPPLVRFQASAIQKALQLKLM